MFNTGNPEMDYYKYVRTLPYGQPFKDWMDSQYDNIYREYLIEAWPNKPTIDFVSYVSARLDATIKRYRPQRERRICRRFRATGEKKESEAR
jgi:hypothetical protein